MAEKTVEKSAGKLVLFNHSRNPFRLKDGPPAEKGGTPVKRIWAVGSQIECLDQAEYDLLKNYRGVGTSQQVAPSLHARVLDLEKQVAEKQAEIENLTEHLEKFKEKKGK